MEDVEYQVQFDAGDKRMAILVSLSPEFPLEKPVLRVSPPITHPWCNEHSEITSAPGLLNVILIFWTLAYMKLFMIIIFFISLQFTVTLVVWCKPLSENSAETHHNF